MWKVKFLMGYIVLLLLAGCQRGELATPTPFPPTPENIAFGAGGLSITPVPAVLADIMANPEFYEGAHVQVTGQYFRGPLVVCGADPHLSPAGWELAAGDVRMPAGGFDEQMRQLTPDGLTMTVIGRLTHWRGPVGCGKQAVAREMWYLDVVKMVDPVQLALVTLTPQSGAGDIISDGGIADDLFTPVSGSDLNLPGENGFPGTPVPTAPPLNTAVPTRAIPVETLSAGFTPVATDEILVATPIISSTPTGVGTAVISGTVTLTNTPPPGTTATPTTENSSTPIATGIGGSSVKVMPGDIGDPLYFKIAELAASEIQEWTMPLEAGERVIVSAIGEPSMDVTLAIYDANSNELAKGAQNPAGRVETITFNPPAQGNYKVRVSEATRKPGGYLLAVGEELYQLLPQGQIPFGSTVTKTIYEDEVHYWFFKGEQGNIIDLTVVSDQNTQLLILLYDSSGNLLSSDEIQDMQLAKTDWYVFEVEEWVSDLNTYQLTLTK